MIVVGVKFPVVWAPFGPLVHAVAHRTNGVRASRDFRTADRKGLSCKRLMSVATSGLGLTRMLSLDSDPGCCLPALQSPSFGMKISRNLMGESVAPHLHYGVAAHSPICSPNFPNQTFKYCDLCSANAVTYVTNTETKRKHTAPRVKPSVLIAFAL